MTYLSPKAAALVAVVSILSATSFAHALPGDTLGAAANRLSNSALLQGRSLQRRGSAPYFWYETTVQHNGETVKVAVSGPGSRWEDSVSGSISLTNSTIGSRLSVQDYNLRQDEAFLEILRGAWGDAVAQDFIGSRFTDRRREVTEEYRTAYRGQRFGYIASQQCAYRPQCEFQFVIYSHNDWEFRRVPLDF